MNNTKQIEKRPIPGWEGMYSATSDGQIISEERTVKCPLWERTQKEKTLKPVYNKKTGYFTVQLCRNNTAKRYYVHRLVGSAFHLIDFNNPKQQIDHVDNNPRNNHLDNLRAATSSENMAWGPKSTNSNNTSGFRGVCLDRRNKKWHARIMVNRKSKHLGYFEEKLDAARAYDEAARELFGEFAFSNLSEEAA